MIAYSILEGYMGHLMDINELADYLNIEKQTVYNWLYKKKISGIKIGHIWRFDKEAIDMWLKSKTVNVNQSGDNSSRNNNNSKKEDRNG